MSIRNYLNTKGQNIGKIHGSFLAIDVTPGSGITKSYTANGSILLTGSGGGGILVIADGGSLPTSHNGDVYCEGNAELVGDTSINGNVYVNASGTSYTFDLHQYNFNLLGDFHGPFCALTRTTTPGQTLGFFFVQNCLCTDMLFSANNLASTLVNGAFVFVYGNLGCTGAIILTASNGGQGGQLQVGGCCTAISITARGGSLNATFGGRGGDVKCTQNCSTTSIDVSGGSGSGGFDGGDGGIVEIDGLLCPLTNDQCFIYNNGGSSSNGKGGRGGQIILQNGGNCFKVDIGLFSIQANGGDSFGVGNNAGNGGTLNCNGGTFAGNDVIMFGGVAGDISGFNGIGGSINLRNCSMQCTSILLNAGDNGLSLRADGGTINLDNSSISCEKLQLNGSSATADAGDGGSVFGVKNSKLYVSSDLQANGGNSANNNGGNGGGLDFNGSGEIFIDTLNMNGGTGLASGGNGGKIDVFHYKGRDINIEGGSSDSAGGNGGAIFVAMCDLTGNVSAGGGSQIGVAGTASGGGGTIKCNIYFNCNSLGLSGGNCNFAGATNGTVQSCIFRNLNCDTIKWEEGTGGIPNLTANIKFILSGNNYIAESNGGMPSTNTPLRKLYGTKGCRLNMGAITTNFYAWSTDLTTPILMSDAGYNLDFVWKTSTQIHVSNAVVV